MTITRLLCLTTSVAIFSSCGLGGDDENYDTTDPYGVPDTGGVETPNYQAVNPPAGTDPVYGAPAYEAVAPAPPSPPTTPPAIAGTHTVIKGDTLWGLGKKYNVSADAIRAANGMAAADNNVRLGQTINIPAP